MADIYNPTKKELYAKIIECCEHLEECCDEYCESRRELDCLLFLLGYKVTDE